MQGTIPPLARRRFRAQARRRRAAQNRRNRLQRIHVGGVNVEKILTPEERADKDLLVDRAGTPAVAVDAQGRAAGATLRDFLDSKPKLNDADILTAIRLVMSTPEYQVT